MKTAHVFLIVLFSFFVAAVSTAAGQSESSRLSIAGRPLERWPFIKSAGLVKPDSTQAPLFAQDFSSSTVVTDYVNATTPTNGQFTSIATTGIPQISIANGSLQFVRANNGMASFSRNVDFSPAPSTLIFKADLTVTNTSTFQPSAGTIYIGGGITNSNSTEGTSNIFSRWGINASATSGKFSMRNIQPAVDTPEFSGTQRLTWVLNRSGSTVTYNAPDGTIESIGNNKHELWIGTIKVFDDISPDNTTSPLTRFKFAFSQGSATISFDNISIDPIPPLASPGAVQLSQPSYSTSEGSGSASITLNRPVGSSGAISVKASLSDGTAVGGSSCGPNVDYVNAGPFVVNFGATDTSASFAVPICDDTEFEGSTPENFNVALSNPTGGATIGAQSTAVVNIADDDAAPNYTVAIGDDSETEGNTGTKQFNFTVTLSQAPIEPVSVEYSTLDGTATVAGGDYQAASGTLTWAAGDDPTKQVTVLVNGDADLETNETFLVGLSNAVGATISVSNADGTGTIVNDDDPPASLVVNTIDDQDIGVCLVSPGHCSLREAINAANSLPDANTITFAPDITGTITVGNSLFISEQITINGPGAATLAVSGGGNVSILNITSGSSVNISGLTFKQGAGLGVGSAIENAGTLTLSECVFTANSSDLGGAVIRTSGPSLDVNTTSFTGNQAQAIAYSNSVTISRSTFDNNTISDGSVIIGDGTLTVTNSTISSNTSSAVSSINVQGGTADLVNDTITANHSTATQAAVKRSGGTVNVRNTIISENTNSDIVNNLGANIEGVFVSQGHNFIGIVDGGTGFSAMGDQVGTNDVPKNANLGPLGSNGGPTPTHPLLMQSSAIDAGDDCVLTACNPDYGFSFSVDQRGRPRLTGSHVDIGAFEFIIPVAGSVSMSGQVRRANGVGLRNVRISISGGGLHSPIIVATSSFGYYRVDGLTAGEAYSIHVTSRTHNFAPRVVQLFDSISDVDFVE